MADAHEQKVEGGEPYSPPSASAGQYEDTLYSAGTTGQPVWPASPDHEAPQNPYLYGHENFNGLEVVPSQGLEPAIKRVAKDDMTAEEGVREIEEVDEKPTSWRNRRVCGVRAWWWLIVVVLLLIAGLVAGMVVLGTRKTTTTAASQSPPPTATDQAAAPSTTTTAAPRTTTILGSPMERRPYIIHNAIVVPDPDLTDRDLVWDDTGGHPPIDPLNCTTKTGRLTQQFYFTQIRASEAGETWRTTNAVEAEGWGMFYLYSAYHTLPYGLGDIRLQSHKTERTIENNQYWADSDDETDPAFWFWLDTDPEFPGTYQIKNAQYGPDYSVIMRRMAMGENRLWTYQLYMAQDTTARDNTNRWRLEEILDGPDPDAGT